MLFSKAINGLFLFSMNISINHIIKNVKSFTFCNENEDHLRKMCKLRTCKHKKLVSVLSKTVEEQYKYTEISRTPTGDCLLFHYNKFHYFNYKMYLVLKEISENYVFFFFFLTNNHSYQCKCLFTVITVLTVSYSSQLSFC